MSSRVHLGCGSNKIVGFLNVDLLPSPVTDMTFDATQPWPLPDNSVEYVYASHVVEHLHDHRAFFRHMWNALEDRGDAFLAMPYGAHDDAFADAFHVRPFFPGSFAFLQPGWAEYVKNGQHDGWHWPYAIADLQLRLNAQLTWMARRPFRGLAHRVLPFIWGGYVELGVRLTALKSEASLQMWRDAGGRPECVCVDPVVAFRNWGPLERKE